MANPCEQPNSDSAPLRPWNAPHLQSLDVADTETTVTQWFTGDIHLGTVNYGTPS